MWSIFGIVLRILALFSGCFCIYATLFLYEDEQGRVQSVLEDLWVRVNDFQRVAISRHALFMREVALFTERIFGKVFGSRLLSLRSAAVSSCFSIASICLVVGYRVYTYDKSMDAWTAEMSEELKAGTVSLANTKFSEEYGTLFLPVLGIGMLVFTFLGMFPVLSRNKRLRLWFSGVLFSVLLAACGLFAWEYYGWIRFFIGIPPGDTGIGHISILWENMRFKVTPALLGRADFFALMLLAFLLGVGVGIASDVAFIALTRKILRWGTESASFFAISAMVLFNLLLALILAFGPAGLGYGVSSIVFGPIFPEPQYPAGHFSLSVFAEGLQQVGYVASLSNAITALLACVFVLLAFVTLVHRLFWPLLERPIYALQRFGIARRSKLMGSLGVAFCGLGLGVAPSWLKEIAEKLIE